MNSTHRVRPDLAGSEQPAQPLLGGWLGLGDGAVVNLLGVEVAFDRRAVGGGCGVSTTSARPDVRPSNAGVPAVDAGHADLVYRSAVLQAVIAQRTASKQISAAPVYRTTG
ncbi:MAG: hypothetical protein ACRDT8_25930, partial [Micromonosporaceae bacterium]